MQRELILQLGAYFQCYWDLDDICLARYESYLFDKQKQNKIVSL